MNSLEDTKFIFEERKGEVKEFLLFLDLLINKQPSLTLEGENITIERSLTNILKAQGYLILYNLVESTVANAVSSIHHNLFTKNITFEELPNTLQSKILKQFCKEGASSIIPMNSMSSLSNEIIRKSYNKKSLFSGNVDRKFVTELSREYGFEIQDTDYDITGHGNFITMVKQQRNELAHGNISFTECGRNTSTDELLKAFDQIPNFLESLIKNIEDMLSSYEASKAIVA